MTGARAGVGVVASVGIAVGSSGAVPVGRGVGVAVGGSVGVGSDWAHAGPIMASRIISPKTTFSLGAISFLQMGTVGHAAGTADPLCRQSLGRRAFYFYHHLDSDGGEIKRVFRRQ